MFQLRQSLLLFITASIWGAGFVAQSIGMDHVQPFTFTFFRTLLGGLVLLPLLYVMKLHKQKKQKTAVPVHRRRDLIMGSMACGTCLIVAESFQQFGLVTTDVGKAGFLTSMYIIIVPLLSVLLGHHMRRVIWLGVILSVIGLYLLCIKTELKLEIGDTLILMCALCFAVHIMVINHFVGKTDGVALSCGQFFFASALGFVMMIIHDDLILDNLLKAAPAILWAGIMSNGVAYTLQIIGQRGMNPAIATLIMSLESVMAVVFGIICLNESMNLREYLGCALMFAAVIIAQLPAKKA